MRVPVIGKKRSKSTPVALFLHIICDLIMKDENSTGGKVGWPSNYRCNETHQMPLHMFLRKTNPVTRNSGVRPFRVRFVMYRD